MEDEARSGRYVSGQEKEEGFGEGFGDKFVCPVGHLGSCISCIVLYALSPIYVHGY